MFSRLRNKLAGWIAPKPKVTEPVSVVENYESLINGHVVEANKPAAWSPDQRGGVIVSEPDAVRVDRLRREREGKK
jgi:hypothetical protein